MLELDTCRSRRLTRVVALLIFNTLASCKQESVIRIRSDPSRRSLLVTDRRVGLVTVRHLATIIGSLVLRKYKRLNRRSRQSNKAITSAWPTFSQPSFGLAALVHPGVRCSPIMALTLSTNLMACATSSGICMLLSIPSYRAAM